MSKTWTEVPAPEGVRCWVAYKRKRPVVLRCSQAWSRPWQSCVVGWPWEKCATAAEALIAAGVDLPAPAPGNTRDARTPEPEPWRPKVGEWVRNRGTGRLGLVTYTVDSHWYGVRSGTGAQSWSRTTLEPTTRPDEPWAIALDPRPSESVEVDGRTWVRMRFTDGWRRDGHLGVVPDDGAVTRGALRDVATLPDTLRGIERLRVAGRILDGDLSDLPDGVEVTEAWRDLCGSTPTPVLPVDAEDEAVVAPTPEQDDSADQQEARHPMQSVVFDDSGVARFRANAVVQFLLDEYGPGLNDLACRDWPDGDYTQLMQLMGYSLGGFADLSSSPPDDVEAAWREADRIRGVTTEQDDSADDRPVMAWETALLALGEHDEGWEPMAPVTVAAGHVAVLCRRRVEVPGEE